ncbi:MAG: sulfatase-like hydrolase/transferase, partial [Bryobacteraceae bacterium]
MITKIRAQAARCGINEKKNSADLAAPRESVVREFLMNRRQMLRSIGAGCGMWAGGTGGLAPAFQTNRWNVLLINSDDQRFDTIHALGNRDIRTPSLDRLVARGFTFSNFYAQGGLVGAVCLPSRTMLMTGRSVFHIPERNQAPWEGLPLLPKAFERAGYNTFHAGKKGNTYVPASAAFQTTLYSEQFQVDRAE